MRLDVVIPLYDEVATLPVLVERLEAALSGIADCAWRVVFVDDGSTDGSTTLLREVCVADPRFALVVLARNFGHMPALHAGLDAADGDAVVLMDGDLQDPPEVIHQLVARWREGAEVVCAERLGRDGHGWRAASSRLFHGLFRWVATDGWPRDVGTLSLLDRRAVEALRELGGPGAFLPGQRQWIGFAQGTVSYTRAPRYGGPPRQSPQRLLRYGADAVYGYSSTPLALVAGGAGAAVLAAIAAAWGERPLLAALALATAVQLAALALLGGYLMRIFDRVQGRPAYLVRAVYGFGASPVRVAAAGVSKP